MIFIPDQFKDQKFQFVLLEGNTKRPIEKDWVQTNHYPYNHEKVKQHILKGNNLGILTGNGFCILDIDNPVLFDEIEKILPETLTVQTGSGNGRHYYFYTNPDVGKIVFQKGDIHYGELQSQGQQCVFPGSVHPKTNKDYVIIKDVPIANLTINKIEHLKALYKDKEEVKEFKVEAPWELYKSTTISNQIDITKLVDTTNFKKGAKEWYGAHPIHGSETGMNFFVNPEKNMWHCFTGNQHVFTTHGIKKIKDLTGTEKIFGAYKNIQKITTLFKRRFSGNIFTIKTPYFRPNIDVTEGHPFLVGSLNYVHHRKHKDNIQNVKLHWKNIEDINPEKDFLVIDKTFGSLKQLSFKEFKVSTGSKLPDTITLDREFGEIIGWWLAEGSITKRGKDSSHRRVNYTLSYYETKETKRLKDLLHKKLNLNVTVRRYKSRGTSIIHISSDPLAKFLEFYFSKGSHNKRLGQLLNANREFLEGVVEAYIQGDGSESITKKSFSSTSEQLAKEVQFVLFKLGYNYRMCIGPGKLKVHHRTGKQYYSSKRWRLWYSKTHTKDRSFQDDKYLYLQIHAITKHRKTVDVYNLETEDHTYLIPFVTHNCFRHNAGGDSISYLAVKEGICQCQDFSKSGKKLRGKDFFNTLEVARKSYGLKMSEAQVQSIFLSSEEKGIEITPEMLDAIDMTELEIVFADEVKDLDVPPVKWLIDELIPLKSLTYIAGKSGAYKSITALHFASAISEGKDVFNKYKSEKSRVLYINEENSWAIFKPTVEMIQKGLKTQGTKDLAFCTFQNLSLDPSNIAGRTKLEKILQEQKIDVLVIDVLRRVINFEENDANQVNAFYNVILKPLMKKYNLTVILLHHTKKESMNNKFKSDKKDLIRGSSDFVNSADCILYFDRGLKDLWFDLYQIKIRGAKEIKPKSIKIDTDTTTYFDFIEMTTKSDKNTDIVLNAYANDILHWIVDNELKFFDLSTICTILESKYQDKYKRRLVRYAIDLLLVKEVITKAAKQGSYSANLNHEVFLDIRNEKDAKTL